MKWYKRDPDAWLAGTRALTLEERGAYNDILEMLYSRDGELPDDDRMIARNLVVRPQVWRRIKARLIELGKLRQTQGKLTANRVENEVKTAKKLIENMGVLRQKQLEKQRDMAGGAARTTTTTTTTRKKKDAPNGAQIDPEVDLFRRGKEVAGKDAGGLIAKLFKLKNKNVALTRSVIETASTKQNPREYLAAVIRGAADPGDWHSALAL